MRLTAAHTTALAVVALLFFYFGASALFRGEAAARDDEDAAPDAFSVLVETLPAQEWRDTVVVRGETRAERKVTVRAETAGAVAAAPLEAGERVKAGDVLCRLRVDARAAALAEARASLRKAELDHNAALELAKQGFRSETSLASAQAALDLARASVEQSEIALAQTEIKAPFDGVFDERLAEVGDFLKVGEPCGVVLQLSPFLVVGAVSERDVAKISVGDPGSARLATGEAIDGTVRYVAAAADPATRTFDVELEIANETGALRDGVTASFEVFARPRTAHKAPRSALTLDDNGRLGFRLVDDAGLVSFAEITMIGETPEGVWVDGLEGAPRVIVRGQDYVRAGQSVVAQQRDPA